MGGQNNRRWKQQAEIQRPHITCAVMCGIIRPSLREQDLQKSHCCNKNKGHCCCTPYSIKDGIQLCFRLQRGAGV